MRHHPRGLTLRRGLIILAVLLAALTWFISRNTCLSVGLRTGLWLDRCPDGELRQPLRVDANGLKRGAASTVGFTAYVTYLAQPGDSRFTEAINRFTPELSLVQGEKVTPLTPKKGWEEPPSGGARFGEIELPKVNDGDYVLRARVVSPVGASVLELPLALYAPARVHVLTDRPLYEPGNTVRFRGVALKANDLSPLEDRPGLWVVRNSEGEVLLEEKAPTGPWGVVAGSFPLDKSAVSGEWTVTWRSGGTEQTRSFTVKPFTLPRFRVEASSAKPFYRRGEKPALKGTVKYASGAPVANAKVELSWNVVGEWPPPTSWSTGDALPRHATTSAGGTFSVELPQIPNDLLGKVTLAARLTATDASGDAVTGAAAVLLSEDAIAVEAVPELSTGIVEGLNNRLFLRATTADGRLLEGVTLNVKRLWEPGDKGTEAPVDEDGVASVQLDPGPPVNIVIPAMPFRPPPPVQKVTRESLEDRLGDDDVSFADRMTFDRLDARLESCSGRVNGAGEDQVTVLVHANGKIGALTSTHTSLGACVEKLVRETSFAAGKERFFDASWSFDDSELPRLYATETEAAPNPPAGFDEALSAALLDARSCLPALVRSGRLPRLLEWSQQGRDVALTWAPTPGDVYAESAVSCITSRVKSFKLRAQNAEDEEENVSSSIGYVRVGVTAPERYQSIKPQDTVMEGYEFLVSAKRGGELFGSTKVRLSPGSTPSLRLRLSTQLAAPGDEVKVTLLRGPDFVGELPEKLTLVKGYDSLEADVGKESHEASFKVPAGWQGWAQVGFGGAQSFLYVKPATTLTVAVTPEKPRYAPGQVAQLGIETKVGGRGGAAAVGLFGVDESLSQLTSLPGPDELASLRPNASGESAFGVLDAQALVLGRVRGANATAATLARINAIPSPPELEGTTSVAGETVFDPNETQVDRFYVVLGELNAQVRAWESSAPASEKLTPKTLARLWNTSLDALEKKKESVDDAWGRRLRLHRLPYDLLTLTEPRQLVVDGTRLPEDLENWQQWVAKEQP